MAYIEGRTAKSRCILCENDVEKSNLSSVCNNCKDERYRHIVPAQKGKAAKEKSRVAA